VLAGNEHQMIGEPDSKLNSEFAELLNSHIRNAVTTGNQTKTITSSISSLVSWSTIAFTVASTSFSRSRWTRSLSTLGSVFFVASSKHKFWDSNWWIRLGVCLFGVSSVTYPYIQNAQVLVGLGNHK
jgi:hypothetical protein